MIHKERPSKEAEAVPERYRIRYGTPTARVVALSAALLAAVATVPANAKTRVNTAQPTTDKDVAVAVAKRAGDVKTKIGDSINILTNDGKKISIMVSVPSAEEPSYMFSNGRIESVSGIFVVQDYIGAADTSKLAPNSPFPPPPHGKDYVVSANFGTVWRVGDESQTKALKPEELRAFAEAAIRQLRPEIVEKEEGIAMPNIMVKEGKQLISLIAGKADEGLEYLDPKSGNIVSLYILTLYPTSLGKIPYFFNSNGDIVPVKATK